jgi:hypothetical protein
VKQNGIANLSAKRFVFFIGKSELLLQLAQLSQGLVLGSLRSPRVRGGAARVLQRNEDTLQVITIRRQLLHKDPRSPQITKKGFAGRL